MCCAFVVNSTRVVNDILLPPIMWDEYGFRQSVVQWFSEQWLKHHVKAPAKRSQHANTTCRNIVGRNNWSNLSQQHPTCRNMSQHGGQTHATCCAQQCCDMLCWHVAVVWPGLNTLLLQPIKYKTKCNCDWLPRLFPRFVQVALIELRVVFHLQLLCVVTVTSAVLV